MNKINKSMVSAFVASALSLVSASAFAVESIIENAKAGCQEELTKYCKDVTPGKGRILACLTAYEDKLSARCDYALYTASAELKELVAAINHVATECKADLQAHCSNIAVGEGRIAQCLKKNEATASPACKQAIKDTQMEVN
jgi:Cysteine rich repeat